MEISAGMLKSYERMSQPARMNIFQRKITSQKTLIITVICLWAIAYVIGIGAGAISNPISIVTSLPITLLMGWLFIPENFLRNLTGITHESTPVWFHYAYFSLYYAALVGLHVAVLQTKRWWLLVMLAITLLMSTYGCNDFINSDFENMG